MKIELLCHELDLAIRNKQMCSGNGHWSDDDLLFTCWHVEKTDNFPQGWDF